MKKLLKSCVLVAALGAVTVGFTGCEDTYESQGGEMKGTYKDPDINTPNDESVTTTNSNTFKNSSGNTITVTEGIELKKTKQGDTNADGSIGVELRNSDGYYFGGKWTEGLNNDRHGFEVTVGKKY